MSEFKINRALDIRAELGEGATWSVEDEALFWVDLMGGTINRFHPGSGKNVEWKLPAEPGSFALREDNSAVIAAADGLYDIDFESGAIKKLFDAPFDAMHRFNDGRTDRQGRYWFGSIPAFTSELEEMHQSLQMPSWPNTDQLKPIRNSNAYYRYDGTTMEVGFSPVTVANGTAFSPDGKTMYHAESLDGLICARDYDPVTGTAAKERRIFAQVPREFGMPDGAAIDTEGGYWLATTNGFKTGHILRYTADGKLDIQFEMPVLMPTMVAFGGPKLSTLYITSMGSTALSDESLGEMAGSIFSVETSFTGIPDVKMAARR